MTKLPGLLLVLAPMAVEYCFVRKLGLTPQRLLLLAGTSVLSACIGFFVAELTNRMMSAFAKSRGTSAVRQSPPVNAQFMLDMILPQQKLDDQLNTLEELYRKKLPRLGQSRADIWYWKAALGLFSRQILNGRKKLTVRALAVTLRLFGLGTVADALNKAALEALAPPPEPKRRRRAQ